MQRIHVFRAGTHTAMSGRTLEFTDADLAASARAYDPARHEAPIVVGHPKLDAPAYGWIGKLSADGGDLFAAPREVEPAFAELVVKGRFKKISASFYAPDAPSNPAPGVWYLKHVGFLGAAPPAVKGLKPVEFADDDQVVTVEFAEASPWRLSWLLSDIAALFRGVRDHLVARDGVEEAEKVLSGDRVQRIAEEAARMQAEAATAPASSFAEPPATPPAPSTEKTRVTEEELAARESALAQKEAAFAAKRAADRAAEDAAFVDALVKDARLPAGLKPRVVAFMGALDAEAEISFADGGTTVKETPRDAFRALLSALPQTVQFGELGGGDGPNAGDAPATAEFAGQRTDPERLALHRNALAYQKAHPGTDYVTAVMAVEQAG